MNTYSSLKYFQIFLGDLLILKYKEEKSKNLILPLLAIELKRVQYYVHLNNLLINLLNSNLNIFNKHLRRRK